MGPRTKLADRIRRRAVQRGEERATRPDGTLLPRHEPFLATPSPQIDAELFGDRTLRAAPVVAALDAAERIIEERDAEIVALKEAAELARPDLNVPALMKAHDRARASKRAEPVTLGKIVMRRTRLPAFEREITPLSLTAAVVDVLSGEGPTLLASGIEVSARKLAPFGDPATAWADTATGRNTIRNLRRARARNADLLAALEQIEEQAGSIGRAARRALDAPWRADREV